MSDMLNKRRRVRVPPKIAKTILTHIRHGTTIANAAEAAGIHRDTFHEWVRRGEKGEEGYAQFAIDVRRARAEAEWAIFSIVRQSMGAPKGPGQPDVTYAWKWLATRNRAEYAEHHIVTGADGGPVQVHDLTKLSDEDLKRVVAGEFRPQPTPPPA